MSKDKSEITQVQAKKKRMNININTDQTDIVVINKP